MVTLSTMSGYDIGIYIGMVVVSLLSPYVDFKKNHCEKGKKYTLEDLYNTIDNTYWVVCFTPMFNANDSHSVISGSIDNTTV